MADRAPPPLRPAGMQRDTLLTDAREAREERQRARAQATQVVVIQRVFRRYKGRQWLHQALCADLGKKLGDLGSLRDVLAKHTPEGGRVGAFCPPVQTSMGLVRQYLVCRRSPRQEDHKQILRSLCELVLLPGFGEEKLVAAAFLEGPGRQFTQLVEALVDAVGEIEYAHDEDPLAIVLEVLRALCVVCYSRNLGPKGPAFFLATVVPRLFPALRAVCLAHDTLFFHPSKQLQAGSCTSEHSQLLALTSKKPLVLLFALVEETLRQGIRKEDDGTMATSTPATKVPSRCTIDPVAGYYAQHLLTVPLFACRSRIDHLPFLGSLVKSWHDDAGPLPPSPDPAATSLVWFVSNVSWILSATLPGMVARAKTGTSADLDTVWLDGLGVLATMLRQCPAAVASEEGILSFEKSGALLTTHVVDPLIVAALQATFKETFVRTLVLWAIAVGGFDGRRGAAYLKAAQRDEDKQDMREALHATALDLTYESHQAQQALESASWFSKLTRRVWGSQPRNRPAAPAEQVEGEEEGAVLDLDDKAPLYSDTPRAERTLDCLCRFLAVVLWKCHSLEVQGRAGSSHSTKRQQVVGTLTFSGPTTSRLWVHLLTRHRKALQHLDRASIVAAAHDDPFLTSLVVFATVYQHELVVVTDEDMQQGRPLALPHVVRVVKLLTVVCYRGCVAHATDPQAAAATSNRLTDVPYGRFLLATLCRLLRALYDRWSRKAFCAAHVFELDRIARRPLRPTELTPLEKLVLQAMPFVVPFSDRLALFRAWVQAEKCLFQEGKPPVMVKIRRGLVLEDGLALLNTMPRERLKHRIVVVYISEAGAQEAGIDLGGLTKDYVNDVCGLLFDPSFGLFAANRGGFLYPNPCASLLHQDYAALFEFAGKILAKALYESIVVGPLLLPVMLGYLKGNYNYMNMLQDLRDLDLELHKNLQFLRRFDDDHSLEDLGLCFAVTHNDLGMQREIELIPRGADTPVTVANRLKYINMVAKHHVVDRLSVQSQAFLRGFHTIVPPYALQMFNEAELQILISGSITGGVDLEDLRVHTRYEQGYRGADKCIRRLWLILADLDDRQRAQFLHFVTSCSRPPVGGFANLEPPFTVVRVPLPRGDEERLPTARTCYNQFLWPTYSSKHVAKTKLLQAINSNAGFELS